jgi:hypothetical protein
MKKTIITIEKKELKKILEEIENDIYRDYAFSHIVHGTLQKLKPFTKEEK